MNENNRNTAIMNSIMRHYDQIVVDRPDLAWRKARMTIRHANEFFVGVILDQRQKLERAWDGGKHFCDRFDHANLWEEIANTDIRTLRRISREGFGAGWCGWTGSYAGLNVNKFPGWVKEGARLILRNYKGDVRNIWRGTRPEEVGTIYDRFLEFPGIGDALAKMAQFALVRGYGIGGGEKNKSRMQVKPDVHVCRVTHRAGLTSKPNASVVASEIGRLPLESPADFDLAVLFIGRDFCHRTEPECTLCPIDTVCRKAHISGN